ncbi:hypothetical protein F5I97DRAFT_1914538 [Phlebopus sp. FC_14]|nr:hypothetical protein F5I97DRAFT_1914538 [Phlebopus sp. FC_14]
MATRLRTRTRLDLLLTMDLVMLAQGNTNGPVRDRQFFAPQTTSETMSTRDVRSPEMDQNLLPLDHAVQGFNSGENKHSISESGDIEHKGVLSWLTRWRKVQVIAEQRAHGVMDVLSSIDWLKLSTASCEEQQL